MQIPMRRHALNFFWMGWTVMGGRKARCSDSAFREGSGDVRGVWRPLGLAEVRKGVE